MAGFILSTPVFGAINVDSDNIGYLILLLGLGLAFLVFLTRSFVRRDAITGDDLSTNSRVATGLIFVFFLLLAIFFDPLFTLALVLLWMLYLIFFGRTTADTTVIETKERSYASVILTVIFGILLLAALYFSPSPIIVERQAMTITTDIITYLRQF